jgi:hypothetical protein
MAIPSKNASVSARTAAVCALPHSRADQHRTCVRKRTDCSQGPVYGSNLVVQGTCSGQHKQLQTQHIYWKTMLNTTFPYPVSSHNRNPARSFPDDADTCAPSAPGCHGNDQFISLLDAYRCSGGLARAQEVFVMFRNRSGPSVTELADWISDKQVICFDWQSTLWLPLFQFKQADMKPQAGLAQVLAELSPGHDAWELADWFTQTNPWLGYHTPVDKLASDLPAVLQAARAEQFVSR